MAGVTLVLQRPLVRFQREIRGLYSQVYNRFIEAIENIRIVKVFTAEELAGRRILDQFARMQQLQLRRDLVAGLLSACSTLLAAGVSVVLLWVGAATIVSGRLTMGELMLFSAMLGFLLTPVQGLTMSITTLRQASVGMERLAEVESVEPERKGGDEKLRPESLRGAIELEQVSFAYRRGYPVLSEVSFRIVPGQTTAIVGETGSGKTSIANLLAAFYEASEGSVRIDGVDVKQYDRSALRRHIGIVFQDPSLGSGTVRENVMLGDPEACRDRVEQATRVAGAHDFIQALPKQYDYEVGDRGVALSSGQRQRIAIARALLRDPAILILDEATSNLDVETERRVMDSILASRAGKTTIVITHRLQNVRRAQQILVLERGQILERGGHAELLALGGRYSALWSTFGSGGSQA
jgi:ABC-type multidrug transport system fused ATPase/permease subunit